MVIRLWGDYDGGHSPLWEKGPYFETLFWNLFYFLGPYSVFRVPFFCCEIIMGQGYDLHIANFGILLVLTTSTTYTTTAKPYPQLTHPTP